MQFSQYDKWTDRLQLDDVVAGQPDHSKTPKSCHNLDDADIKSLTVEEPQLLKSAAPAFQNYNEGHLTTVELPGGSQSVLACPGPVMSSKLTSLRFSSANTTPSATAGTMMWRALAHSPLTTPPKSASRLTPQSSPH